MVVVGIFHSEWAEENAIRLVGAHSDEIYEERIADQEILLSVRARDLRQAEKLRAVLKHAGAEHIEIDAEAA